MNINRGDRIDQYPFQPQREDRDYVEEKEAEERRRLATPRQVSRAAAERKARLWWDRRGGHDECW